MRWLPYTQAPGTLQMATDTVLLDGLRWGFSPPTLRFYGWSPPALSLGYHQPVDPRWQEVPIVRRPTGGRAVWHADELTYALTVTSGTQTVTQSYLYLSEFLLTGAAHLGIQLSHGEAGRGYIHNPSCFGTATRADLVWQGRKLIGSAQARRGGAILQHGSILLEPDYARLDTLFGPQSADRVVGLRAIQPAVSVPEVMTALSAALEKVAGVHLVSGELNAWEQISIAQVDELCRVH